MDSQNTPEPRRPIKALIAIIVLAASLSASASHDESEIQPPALIYAETIRWCVENKGLCLAVPVRVRGADPVPGVQVCRAMHLFGAPEGYKGLAGFPIPLIYLIDDDCPNYVSDASLYF